MTSAASMKRVITIAQLVFCLGLIVRAQAQGQPAGGTQANSNPKTVTVKGCMTGYEGHYTIGTSRDDLYLLNGDVAMFKQYNGKTVEATGTIAPAKTETSSHDVLSQQPPQLTVTKLKKLADRCVD